MTIHSDTDIYRAVVDLAKHVTNASVNMRRDVKQLVGRMLLDESLWMGVLIMRANIAREEGKVPHLVELLEHLEIIQFSLRMARDLRFIAPQIYADSLPLMASVGKQATALKNHYVPASTPAA